MRACFHRDADHSFGTPGLEQRKPRGYLAFQATKIRAKYAHWDPSQPSGRGSGSASSWRTPSGPLCSGGEKCHFLLLTREFSYCCSEGSRKYFWRPSKFPYEISPVKLHFGYFGPPELQLEHLAGRLDRLENGSGGEKLTKYTFTGENS